MIKKYMLAICMIMIGLTGCGNNKLMRAEDAGVVHDENAEDETVSQSADEGSENANENSPSSNDEPTDVTPAQVIERNMSEELISTMGNIRVTIGEMEGYTRVFGSQALIEYVSANEQMADATFQIYEGYTPAKVRKLVETFANSSDYGNEMQGSSADLSYTADNLGELKGCTLSYTSSGNTIYQMLLVYEISDDVVLAINYQQNNDKFDAQKIAKVLTSAVSIGEGKAVADDKSEEANETTNDASSEEVATEETTTEEATTEATAE